MKRKSDFPVPADVTNKDWERPLKCKFKMLFWMLDLKDSCESTEEMTCWL